MTIYTEMIKVSTNKTCELVDITEFASDEVHRSGISTGICSLFAQGATAALMIQENDDPNIPTDVLNCLKNIVPDGIWLHDRIDNNGASHIKAGIIGASETIPIVKGKLALSTWQNIFLCDFDGPRHCRTVLVTIIGD